MGNTPAYSSWTTAENVFEWNQKASVRGKVAIITGCSHGVGLETARSLYWHGCHVVMACRNSQSMEHAALDIQKNFKGGRGKENVHRGRLTKLIIDLSSQRSVRHFVSSFLDLNLPLHYLVLNAGVMVPEKQVSEDGFDLMMATNYFGHFTVVLSLLHVMTKSGKENEKTRIIVVGSEAHRIASEGKDVLHDINYENREYKLQGYMAYAESKYASLLFALELNRRLKGLPVRAFYVHPGFVASNIGHNLGAVGSLVVKALYLTQKSTEQGAATLIYCCIAPELEKTESLYFIDCKEAQPSGVDEFKAFILFRKSEQLTNTSFPPLLVDSNQPCFYGQSINQTSLKLENLVS